MTKLLNPVVMEYSNEVLENYLYLPTIKYRENIIEICSELSKIGGIKYFYLLISSNFSKPLCLGNTPHWSITYHKFNLACLDVGINPTANQSHIITEQIPMNNLSQIFYQWMEAYGIYETYSIIRQAEDIKIIAIAHHDNKIICPIDFYNNTVSNFENFTIKFIDEMINIIKETRPIMGLTRFIQDRDYRHDIIKRKYTYCDPILSPREKQIIMYAFHGYSAKEIAKCLNIGYRAIEKYTNNLKVKLQAKNITHAIKKAIDFGLLNN